MRLTVICNEPPYPPFDGGRSDAWHRLQAFKEKGVALQVITWQSDRLGLLSADNIKAMKVVADDLIICRIGFDIPSLLHRIWNLRRYPSHVAARVLRNSENASVLASVRKFQPDAIWIDQIYGGVLAQKLSKTLQIPMFSRSSNIEHIYMNLQLSAESSFIRKFALTLVTLHLKSFEFGILRSSDLFFDISMDDLSFWRNKGFKNGRWLPPIFSGLSANTARSEPIKYDVAFLGNLKSPNNVEGVRWFLTKVLPKLVERRPDIRIAIGGSNPEATVKNLCAMSKNVYLVENPESSLAFYASASVLINPIFKGSGVNIKSIEMLFTDKTIITTKLGTRGLPDDVKEYFCIADSAEIMANAICNVLDGDKPPEPDRQFVRRYFLTDVIDDVLHEIEKFIGPTPPTKAAG
ncbi:MAG: glycosyltransferase [Desulfuromonadaceae bacterium]